MGRSLFIPDSSQKAKAERNMRMTYVVCGNHYKKMKSGSWIVTMLFSKLSMEKKYTLEYNLDE